MIIKNETTNVCIYNTFHIRMKEKYFMCVKCIWLNNIELHKNKIHILFVLNETEFNCWSRNWNEFGKYMSGIVSIDRNECV